MRKPKKIKRKQNATRGTRFFSLALGIIVALGLLIVLWPQTLEEPERPLRKSILGLEQRFLIPGTCTGWHESARAKETDLLGSSARDAFDDSNSAFIPGKEAVLGVGNIELEDVSTELRCDSFAFPEDIEPNALLENIFLRLSLAADGVPDNEDVLALSYSTDDGASWHTLESFPLIDELSNNINDGFFRYELPELTDPKNQLGHLIFRAEYYPGFIEQHSQALIDGVNIAMSFQTDPEEFDVDATPLEAVQIAKGDFQMFEDPVIRVDIEERSALSFIGIGATKREVTNIKVTDPVGTIIPDVAVSEVKKGKKTIAEYRIDETQFTQPGQYQVQIEITQDGETYLITQDFTWGVLALNVLKSVALPGETVNAGMAVLTPGGNTLCDAELELIVTSPSGTRETFRTTDGTIALSSECGPETVTNVPDYAASFTAIEVGLHGLALTARTEYGEYTITDALDVRASVPFDVTRLGPTRIYPEADYTMYMEVVPTQDLLGTVEEFVPAGFVLSNVSDGGEERAISDAQKAVRWLVDWKAGQSYTLSYTFDAPNVSPEFYLLGPATFGASFVEARQWQIASDATDNMLAFWAGGDPPAGWTCVSCGSGDFYQKFPRGAATYGGTGGAATHNNHSISWVSTTGTITPPFSNIGGAVTVAAKVHTHPWISSASMGSGTLLPAYQNLKVIRYDTTGTPATIPSGVILMFDAAPTGSWSRYTAQDNDMIYGENDATGTGGTATHTHGSVGYTVDSSTETSTPQFGMGGVFGAVNGHQHTVSGATTASGNHTPPYLGVLLYSATADNTLPSDAIAMWDDTPADTDWSVVSGAAQSYNGKFLMGVSSYTGTPGGNSTHNHSNLGSTTSAPTGGTVEAEGGTKGTGAVSTHTHTATVSFGNVNNLPPYIDVIMAKYTAPVGIDISGRIYTDEGSTGLDCGTPRTVHLRINGSGTDTVECSNSPSNGSFSFSGVFVDSADIVTLYLDNETEEATTVFVSDGTSQTDVALYQDFVVVRADTGSIINANLVTGDDADDDVKYNVASSNLTVDSGFALHVWTGDTFAPGGTVTMQGAGGSVHINTSATLNMAGSALSVTGSFDNDGTYTPGANLTYFAAPSGTVTISSASAFNNISFNEDGGPVTYTHSSALDVNGTFTLLDGTFQQGANVNLNIAGNIELANASTFTKASGTGLLILDGDLTFFDWHASKQDMGNVHIGTSPDTTDLTSDMAATSLTVNAADIFNTNGYDLDIGTGGITVSGTLDATDDAEGDDTSINTEGLFDLNSGATFTQDQSTVTFDATSGTDGITDDATLTFYNLVLNDAGGSLQVDAVNSFEVSNNLTITNGTLNIASGQTVTHNGATLTLSDIISGAGRLTYTSATAFPATGTISSILRFDATGGNQTMSARTYGGNVEVYNNSASTRTVTAAAGTETLSANLDLSTGNAAVTLDLNANNPTFDVAGNVTIGASTTLIATTSAFTVAGNWDNNGTFTHSSGTVTMDAADTDNTIECGASSFNALTLAGSDSSGTWTAQTDNCTVAGTLNVDTSDVLTITTVTVTHSGATLTLNGTISGTGRLTYLSATNFPTSGTISSILRYDMTATAQNVTNRTYGGLVEIYANTASTRSATALAGTTVMTGGLTLSTGNAAVTFDQTTSDPTLTVTGTVTIGTGTTFSASNSATTSFADSYINNGTFTANSGIITFTATDAGNTLSGTLNGSSAFYKVRFNGTGGEWTTQDPMLISAANDAATLQLYAGTVTVGNGNGDNFEVDGRVVIAGNVGETATLQTAALAEGSSLIFDMNANTSTPTCANCYVQVGVGGGAGTGIFKVQKNTILRLNPRSAATASDTGVQVQTTGNFQVVGSLDDSGTSDSTTNETTLTDTTKAWTTDAHIGKKMRISNTSSLAYGRVYPITANTATALTYTTTASASSTIASITNTGANPTRIICSASNALITADDAGIGRYLHDTTGTAGYFQIVDSTNNNASCSSNDSFVIVAIPTAFTALAVSDAIQVSDGLQQGDQYEILDYAYVTAENGTACNAAVNEAGEAYIYGNAASQLTIQYADVCNLGRNAGGYRGLEASGIDGSVANAGILIDRSELHGNAWNYFGVSPNNNSTYGYGVYRNLIYSNATHAMRPGGNGMEINGNRIYSNTGYGVYGANATTLVISNNHIYLNSSDGIEIEGAGATVSGNTTYKNTGSGIYFVTSDNCSGTSNATFSNTVHGIYDNSASYNNTYTGNSVYYNDSYGLRINSTTNTTATSNAIYANKSYGLVTSNTVKNIVARSNTIYYNTLIDVLVGKTTYSIFENNTIYNIGSPTATYGIYISNTPNSNNVFIGNAIYNQRYAIQTSDNAAVTNTVFINEQYGVSGNNAFWDINSGGYADQLYFYNSTFGSTTENNALTPANAFYISRKHDGVAGATKVWGEYAVQADNTETPQNEATDQFNYANDLWPDSFTPHGFSVGYGAGSEDTDLDYAVSGTFGGDASAYSYRVVCTAANCVSTGSSWDVYRNGTLLTAKASTGSLYTDAQVDGSTAPSIQFKIDDAGTDYTAGAMYTFVAWKASGDTSTQKAITMAQDGDKFTVASGRTLELKGNTGGANPTLITRGATGGYQFSVSGAIDADGYSFNYLGGASQASGLDINSGATVTSLDNGYFDNFGTNVGSADSFIDIDSSLIGSGTPTRSLYKVSFDNTTGYANCNINATGADAAGYWEFLNSTGAFTGESYDCNDAAADGTPGQISWGDPSITLSISDTAIGFGSLSDAAARYATDDEAGSDSEVEAHTVTASTNSDNGYSITVQGSTLTSGGDTISAIGPVNTASDPGTEQFGLRMTASGGSGAVSAPYAASGFALDTAAFPDEVVSSSTADSGTTYSARYLANISGPTEAGIYNAILTYIVVGSF
ncbi:MAG: right-handed parallel beta-helix repeat-containing protein [Patescibacteria group bacterium]|jgi:hypothetical protein